MDLRSKAGNSKTSSPQSAWVGASPPTALQSTGPTIRPNTHATASVGLSPSSAGTSAATGKPLKTAFRLGGTEALRGRYKLKLNIDPNDRVSSRARLVEHITCRASYCYVTGLKAANFGGASSVGQSPKKKKSVKESDLVKGAQSVRSRTHEKASAVAGLHAANDACTYIVVNYHDSVFLYDLQSSVEEAVGIAEFHQQPLCHDINPATACPEHVDLCIGFASGDIAIWNPLQRRMDNRFNRDKSIDTTAVTCVRWLPFEPNFVAITHESGCLYVYDRRLTEEAPLAKDCHEPFRVHLHAKSKCNPTQKWVVSSKALTDVVFSPSHRFCAVPSRDSNCHVVFWEERRLKFKIESFFGAILCVAWSHDEHYLVTGGEDDVVSIYDCRKECVLAKCSGHHSWVTAVAFDPWRSEKLTDLNEIGGLSSDSATGAIERYCIVSAGQDSRLLFWDFEPLPAEEEVLMPAEQCALAPAGRPLLPGTSQDSTGCTVVHTLGKSIPILDPIGMQRVHQEPLCGLVVCKDGLITVCAGAIIKFWQLSEDNAQ